MSDDPMLAGLDALLGFSPTEAEAAHIRGVAAEHGWTETPHLLAALFCQLRSTTDRAGEMWLHSARVYAQRGGYRPAGLGL
jgi:hypothetical protein